MSNILILIFIILIILNLNLNLVFDIKRTIQLISSISNYFSASLLLSCYVKSTRTINIF